MINRRNKLLLDALRMAVCGVALWVVVRGVSLDDRMVLSEGRQVVAGTIEVQDAGIAVTSRIDGTRVFLPSEVAVDENGALEIRYGLKTTWGSSRTTLLLAAVLAFSIVPLLQALRIRILLRVQAIAVRYWDALKVSFAGNFLNFATPLGSTAGDVFKAYYLSLYTSRRTEAATLVFLDRAVGLGTLLLVVSLITVLSPTGGRLDVLRPYMIVVMALSALGAWVYFSRWPFLLRPWRRVLRRLPGADHLRRIDDTAVRMIRCRGIFAKAVLITLVLQVFAALSFFVIAMALGMNATLGNAITYYASFSAGEVIKALPGPPQGLGTMELAYSFMLSPFGGPSQILCAAFGIRLVMLLCSLPGLLVTLRGSYRPARATPAKPLSVGVLRPE